MTQKQLITIIITLLFLDSRLMLC